MVIVFFILILYCYNNSLSTLDLSSFSSLLDLKCYGNDLIDLDLSNHMSLLYLSCGYNNIIQLNFINNIFYNNDVYQEGGQDLCCEQDNIVAISNFPKRPAIMHFEDAFYSYN